MSEPVEIATKGRDAVRVACDAAVDAIVTLDDQERAGWAIYILEQLDGADRLGVTLSNVAHDLAERLRAGRW